MAQLRSRLLTLWLVCLMWPLSVYAQRNTSSPNTGSATLDRLRQAKGAETIKGRFVEKLTPKTAAGKVFDARQAEFLIEKVNWGMIAVKGGPGDIGMCWVGGYVYSSKPWDSSWDDHKDLSGPTRNSAAISCDGKQMIVSGLHYFNVHDGARMNDATDWIVEHHWGEYVRDDCVENDHLRSGRVFDCLFDGCYAGISTEPSDSTDAKSADGSSNLVALDRVLLRLQPMPYPYKWKTKKGVIDGQGKPFADSGVPFGHGPFFKLTETERNPHFSIKNCTFLAAHPTTSAKLDFPPESLVDECENNTIIWLGPGDFPGLLPTKKFPNGIRVVTGEEGRELWKSLVILWHARHPDVGPNRKPTSPGSMEFPIKF
jgi:hypothetical protein